jgi:hypothetical protein
MSGVMSDSVRVKIYGIPKEISEFLSSVEGISYDYPPVKMAFDDAIDAVKAVELLISFASGLAVNVFSAWLYERIKSDKKHSVIINENEITAEKVTMVQIVNIINKVK